MMLDIKFFYDTDKDCIKVVCGGKREYEIKAMIDGFSVTGCSDDCFAEESDIITDLYLAGRGDDYKTLPEICSTARRMIDVCIRVNEFINFRNKYEKLKEQF